MTTTLEQLEAWMEAESEGEHLEFKAAAGQTDSRKLTEYCVALANEGGGKIILGVTDKPPRRVVGTKAFDVLERTKSGLFDRLHLRIEAEEFPHPKGRVLIFHVPARPVGTPVQYEGRYLMRVGEELRSMTPDRIKRILDEAVPDFSAQVRPGADLASLDPGAISLFRERWIEQSGNERLARLSDLQLLTDGDLIVDGQVTNAALILMGTRSALRRHQLGQAEVVFEYRNNPDATPYDDRVNFQDGFLLCADRLWETVNLRNEVYQIQEGLFRRDIRSFQERVVREALLNAVAHRDYRMTGSVFVRQSPRKLVVESPGGFLPGITAENILRKHLPRNRLIADTFERCGFVERSGQGVRLMLEESIKEAKLPPDYAGSDGYWVRLTLSGEVQDERFVRFLERVGQETQHGFTTDDYLILDHLRRALSVPPPLRSRLPHLRGLGVIEATGYGKGTRYILSRRHYDSVGRREDSTRAKGPDRETNKELLLKHLSDSGPEGSRLAELKQVLPDLTHRQIQVLLSELRDEERAAMSGRGQSARWYRGSAPIAPDER